MLSSAAVPVTDRSRQACRRKFLRVFPNGFPDAKYLDRERNYKWTAHQRWMELLDAPEFTRLLAAGGHAEVAKRALAVESRTNLLFSFEKIALRDAVRTAEGARTIAVSLHAWLRSSKPGRAAFTPFVEAVERLPRKQTRVLTWPLVTVFGFIANPHQHIFLKPMVTKAAAVAYGRPFCYASRPNWETYADLLAFAAELKEDLVDLKPRDMIDIQSFIWVLGSAEYA